MNMDADAFKIVVYIPEDHSQRMMESVNDVITPFYDGYDMCFSISKVTGSWRPLEGSHPFLGEIGEVETAEELRIEFIVRKDEVSQVLRVIRDIHPYEEPAIDVIPCIGWRSLVQ